MSPGIRNSLIAGVVLAATLAPKFAQDRLLVPDDARMLSDMARLAQHHGFETATVPVGRTFFAVEGRRANCVFRALPIRPGGFQLDVARLETSAVGPGLLWYGAERHRELPRIRPMMVEYTLRMVASVGFAPHYVPLLYVAQSPGCGRDLPPLGEVRIGLRPDPVAVKASASAPAPP